MIGRSIFISEGQKRFRGRPGALTLCVTGAEWLEKGREFVTVDLETGGALTPLPRQVSVRALRTERGQAVVAFLAPEHPDSTPERQHLPARGPASAAPPTARSGTSGR